MINFIFNLPFKSHNQTLLFCVVFEPIKSAMILKLVLIYAFEVCIWGLMFIVLKCITVILICIAANIIKMFEVNISKV